MATDIALLACQALLLSHTLVKRELFISFPETRLLIYNLGRPGTHCVTKAGLEVAATLLPLSQGVTDGRTTVLQVPSNPNRCRSLSS